MSVFVVAEAGVNHNGNLEIALKLVDAAKSASADAVKFQLFNSQRLWGDDRIKHLELSQAQMRDLAAYCKSAEIEFMCSPFGIEEVEFLAPLVKRMKIASGCRKPDLLRAIRKTGLPVILSTGMADSVSLIDTISSLPENTTLLHCTSAYPCPIEAVNLKAMERLKSHFGLPVGYSDHTLGITVPIAAAAMGATVLEKHLTLDRTAEGPDHKASIEPEDFRVMVSAIRTVEQALGDGIKRIQPCEQELRKAWYGD